MADDRPQKDRAPLPGPGSSRLPAAGREAGGDSDTDRNFWREAQAA